ncbi:phage Gp37/Gp68 family protein [Paracoccus sp. (in: a-proteobacteria)]|uniref:phage Gp37/Gp68 family protein n=1 Tax=Paracoccus sp. TaxID=267 RepID=UPI0028AACD8B|nr:phage Gp37/Gp68 family protein [Paracoccus sp. (in: a-proteobacteria)]
MAENSRIEWTRHTFNPWIGCTKVGPGCDHCYAEAWDSRGLQQRETRWGPHAARTRTSVANWRQPLKWNRQAAATGERRRVFCASLADVFDNHPSILPEWRADLWALIEATPNLDWMLLTKRPGNIGNMLPVPFDFDRLYPNVWLGCTVVNQVEADRDIPKLLAVPAAVRFLSMEPLLGPVILDDMCDGHKFYDPLRGNWWHDSDPPRIERGKPKIDLVIVGGESGRGARPMHPDWARSLRDQCQAAGVAFHFKQWGEWLPGQNDIYPEFDGRRVAHWQDGRWGTREATRATYCTWDEAGTLRSGLVTDHEPFRVHRWAQKVGKKAAGRLLDGRTWDEMPGGRA